MKRYVYAMGYPNKNAGKQKIYVVEKWVGYWVQVKSFRKEDKELATALCDELNDQGIEAKVVEKLSYVRK